MLAAPSQRDREFQEHLRARLTERPAPDPVPATSSFIPLRERRH
jgi:hypothetical protein